MGNIARAMVDIARAMKDIARAMEDREQYHLEPLSRINHSTTKI